MKSAIRFLLLSVFWFSACLSFAEPVPVIFDTDMGNDVDDVMALAMLHALQSRGHCEFSGAGRVTVEGKGATSFQPAGDGPDRYLILKPGNVGRVREVIVLLSGEAPH